MSNRRERRSPAPTGRPAGRDAARYGTAVRRNALAPGLLGTIVLVAGLALLGAPGFLLIRYAAAILAAIVAVFAFQARQWWWLPVLGAVVVLWNPVLPFDFAGRWWQVAQLAGARRVRAGRGADPPAGPGRAGLSVLGLLADHGRLSARAVTTPAGSSRGRSARPTRRRPVR